VNSSTGTEASIRSGYVFDDDGLSKRASYPLGKESPDGIKSAARRERHVLIAAPFGLKLGQSAMWLSVVVGVAALLLPALTDHPTGLVRIIPYWLHLWVDRAVGVVFVIAPFAFKFAGLDAWYYWVLAAGVLLSTSVFNAPEKPVATRSGLDTRTAG
jgi:hypothetical protein